MPSLADQFRFATGQLKEKINHCLTTCQQARSFSNALKLANVYVSYQCKYRECINRIEGSLDHLQSFLLFCKIIE